MFMAINGNLRPGTDAISAKVPPSKPKWEINKIAKKSNACLYMVLIGFMPLIGFQCHFSVFNCSLQKHTLFWLPVKALLRNELSTNVCG